MYNEIVFRNLGSLMRNTSCYARR